MSITGDADGPPFRLGVAIADIVTRHVRGAGHRDGAPRARAHRARAARRRRRCSTRRRRCSPTRRAIYFATGAAPRAAGQPASDDRAVRDVRRVATASSCSRSATTSSGGVLPVSGHRRSSPTIRVRDQPRPRDSTTTSCRADSSRTAADADARRVDCGAHRRRRAVRLRARRRARCSPIRSSAARDMIESSSTRRLGAVRVLGMPDQAVGHARRVRTAPPTLGSTPIRFCADDRSWASRRRYRAPCAPPAQCNGPVNGDTQP